MQVANITETASSATLGAGQARRMSMAEDPALYLTMIISLYSNVKLAFIRETICNQWDAHIASGRTDKPIFIGIDEDCVLTFRDYGYGIPVDKMEDTYNTLGGSTKRDSINETGGFGLGCKSPIAYAESFSVTTMHGGIKAIYNMVRSSVETDGFPGLVPILQLPTEETGLEVQIQLYPQDVPEIIGYIKSVVKNGGMTAHYQCTYAQFAEDIIIKPIDMSFEPGSYDVSNEWYYRHMGNHSVFVRYGNVIYPAIETPATEKAISVIKEFMAVVGFNRILVQAAPSTLAVSPSRETLSSQKMTEDGITDLVVNLVDKLEADIKAGIPDAIDQIEHNIKFAKFDSLGLSGFMAYTDAIKNIAVRNYMRSSLWRKQYSHYVSKWRAMEINRIMEDPIIPAEWTKRYKLKQVIRISKRNNDTRPLKKLLYKEVVEKVMRKLVKLGISPKAINFYIDHYGTDVWSKNFQLMLTRNSTYNPVTLLENKTVVVTRRMRNLDGSIDCYPPFKEGKVKNVNSPVIKVGTKKGEAEAMVELLTKAGYEVIDLTKVNDWDWIAQQNKREAAMKRKVVTKATANTAKDALAPNRLISIACLKPSHSGYLSNREADPSYGANHIDVEKPAYYIMKDEMPGGWDKSYTRLCTYEMLNDEMRKQTIICRNKIERNKAIKLGAVHLDEWAKAHILEIIKDKAFIKYAKKERSLVLPMMCITSKQLKLFKMLGVTIPHIGKLRYVREYEAVITILVSSYGYRYLTELYGKELLTKEDVDFFHNLDNASTFEKQKEVRKVTKVFSNGLLCVGYLSPDDVYKSLKAHPECIPAIKQLVKATLKSEGKS